MSAVQTQAPLGVPFLDLPRQNALVADEITAAWSAILDSAGFIGGAYVDAFEAQWAQYCGTHHCVGVANGTDALELILRGLGIGPGDEVIVPANTFVATAEAVLLAGATPHFVDVLDTTLLIDPAAVRAAIGTRTAAVMAVHLYGQPVLVEELRDICAAAGIALIEDAAQAHGATRHGAPAGSFGVAAGFSFYPGKNLGACGDAGAVVTSDGELAERIRAIANHGRANASHYAHGHLGRNSRLDALQAAALSAKLPHLAGWNEARRDLDAHYRARLAGLGDRIRFVDVDPACVPSVHLEIVRVRDRDGVRAHLREHGIATGVHYPVPCHLNPPYADLPRGDVTVTERNATAILSLPIDPTLDIRAVDRVCDVLAEFDLGEFEPGGVS